jgi:uncharacterized protein
MHTKMVYHAAKALARIGVAALRFNFRGVGSQRRHVRRRPGEMDDFRAASTSSPRASPACRSGRRACRSGSWVGVTVGADDPRVSLLVAIAPPVDRYDFDG